MAQVPERLQRWRRRLKSGRSDRGATLVEYALITALVVVGSLAAIESLEDASREETDNQIDCISERPPPSSCQIPAAVPPPDDPDDPGGPDDPDDPGVPVDCDDPDVECEDDDPPPPPPPPPPPVPVSGVFNGSLDWVSDPGGLWYGEAEVQIFTDISTPVEGAVVQIRWNLPSGDSFPLTCTTNASGTCSIRFDVPFADATHVVGAITNVVVAPPLDADLSTFPGALCFARPDIADPATVCP